MKTAYPDTLNALNDMQGSPLYALRSRVLADAERIILMQERQIEALHTELAKFRAVAATSKEALAYWQGRPNATTLEAYHEPMAAEWQTLYVKD